MEMTFDPSKLPTHHSMYTEALQMAVVLRKCCRVHRDTGRSILSNTYIIYFTDNDPLAWALTHRHSSNGRLQQLALEILKRVQSLNSFLCALWVAGTQLIAQGVDDTSRSRSAPASVPEVWISALSGSSPGPTVVCSRIPRRRYGPNCALVRHARVPCGSLLKNRGKPLGQPFYVRCSYES